MLKVMTGSEGILSQLTMYCKTNTTGEFPQQHNTGGRGGGVLPPARRADEDIGEPVNWSKQRWTMKLLIMFGPAFLRGYISMLAEGGLDLLLTNQP